ncbi:MAG: rhomboid family intramembrane serine protease [Alphaproteobacteria bacterium]|nr:rhomboid family intramembrane serine protease [Alphaproteobacteria bacterium]MCZ6764752.1 rhomboid family intramembrane serine protease [Alphaproteobacteria bacterium]
MKQFAARMVPLLALVAVIWIVESVGTVTGHGLTGYGIRPRTLAGLVGVPIAPFVHASAAHAASNTVPLLILGGLISATSRRFWLITVTAILVGGGLTWALARGTGTIHVGASGLVFGYFGYLVVRGLVDRRLVPVVMALGVALVYGGLVFGLVSGGPMISFESHIFGFVAGTVAALAQRPRRYIR